MEARKIGRKKRKKLTKIAIQVECTDEFCWRCTKLLRKRDTVRRYVFLYCTFFKKKLAPAFGESVAERCSDCHMAQRCAEGDFMW
jgi:hypothetical protein